MSGMFFETQCSSHFAAANLPYASGKFWGGLKPLFWGNKTVRWRSATVPLDRAMVSSYGLSIVTTPLTEAISPKFAMHFNRMFTRSSKRPANFQQMYSKHTWIAGRLLDRVNAPYIRLQSVLPFGGNENS